ncbi:MAG: uracil-DNA glycosylase, partial [Balneolales bacterium]
NQQLDNIKTLDELAEHCKSIDLLKTELKEANLVMGSGNPNADLIIIGEAPGKQEDLQGEPFVGRSGQLLTKILKAINFEREDIYIANILKYRPPENRDPRPEERLKSLPYLLKQIDIINPKLILCLGRISAQTLLENNGPMKNMRGSFHPFMGKYELMVTYHPAALLRNPNFKKDTWEDVQELRKRYDELGCKP